MVRRQREAEVGGALLCECRCVSGIQGKPDAILKRLSSVIQLCLTFVCILSGSLPAAKPPYWTKLRVLYPLV